MMRLFHLAFITLLVLAGCGRRESQPKAGGPINVPRQTGKAVTLADARRGFQTNLIRKEKENDPVPKPPADMFQVVHYDSPVGKLAAYVTQPSKPAKKHPAIIWIVGGFSNSIGETAWEDAPPENDQSARAFRKAGIVLMFPSFRRGNDNPGFKEGFLGEVDDVLAAADFLAKLDYVDPQRIYLGGHSTGGTLALLVAASSDRFRATFAFGPVDNVANYGSENLPFEITERELELRAPRLWMQSIQNPTLVFEGTEDGNLPSLQVLSSVSRNPLVRFYPVKGGSHFSILSPVTRVLAEKIVRDDGPSTAMEITSEELSNILSK
jgi:dienelactone hydrolase